MSKQAKILNDFPEELILQILHKLSIKCLGKCMCVCKAWNFLIKNPSFISNHLHNKSPDLFLVWIFRHNRRRKIRYSLHFDDAQFSEYMPLHFPLMNKSEIVGSCNGVVCLVDNLYIYASTFVLWNPCVRKYITIPKSDLIPPQSWWVCCGFGFDSRTNDYKILRVSIKESDEYIGAHIYSLKHDSWKTLPAPKFSIKSDDPMVFVNGVVHWISYRKAENDVFESVVMGFHMGDEVFNMIRLPETESFNYDNLGELYLTMYPETSSIAVMHEDDFSGRCHVWVMKEYGLEETWTKLLSFGKWGEVPEVAAFRKDGGLIVKTFKGEMVSYYPERSEAKMLGIGGEFEYFIVVRHMESLVLHDIGNHEYDDSDLGDSSDESTDTASDSSNDLTDDSSEDGSDDVSDNSTDEGTDNITDEGADFSSGD